MGIHNIYEYNLAKQICSELDEIIPKLKQYEEELKPYRHYLNIEKILQQIQQAETIFKIKYEKYKKILNNKGRLDERK